MVLYFLDALHLAQDHIGVARHTHVAPCFAIVRVLVEHQGLGDGDVVVIQFQGMFAADIYCVGIA